jgi:hypothetical protein
VDARGPRGAHGAHRLNDILIGQHLAIVGHHHQRPIDIAQLGHVQRQTQVGAPLLHCVPP